jgi:hypothetical protein
VIPTLSNKSGRTNQPSEYASGNDYNEEEAKEGEAISNDKRAAADPLSAVFGEPTVRKIFSKTWGLREEGLNQLEDEILAQQKYDPGEAFVAGIGVVKHTIGDKIVSVCQRSVQFLTNLCTQMDPELDDSQRRELNGHTEFIISSLVEKLGDNLAKVR